MDRALPETVIIWWKSQIVATLYSNHQAYTHTHTYTALLCIVKPQLAHTDEWRTENGLYETVIGQDTRTSVDLSMSKAQTDTKLNSNFCVKKKKKLNSHVVFQL